MGKTSAKSKIIILTLLWLGLSLAMLFYFFKFLDDSNKKMVFEIQQQQKVLSALKTERDNYNQARADLAKLAKEELQPDDFFSRDVTFVNEIKTLESWEEKLGIDIQLSGISGTVANAPKAKTTTALAVIPFGVSLSGPLPSVIAYLKVLENLSFITHVNSIGLASGKPGKVNLSLGANFYLKK